MDLKPWLKKYDPEVPANLSYPAYPLTELLSMAANKFGNHPCTIFHDQSISYLEMEKLTDRIAAGLIALGVRKGESVGVLLPNIPQFVAAFMGF
jgi:long-chain acyl-CoA synthetase